jgi:hypothetical protein
MTKAAPIVLLALALVGCSAASPGAGSTAAASATSVASTAPSAANPAPPSMTPSAAASPSSAAGASIDIATVLPKTAGGHPLETKVVAVASLPNELQNSLKAIAQFMDVDVSAMKVAIGWGGQSQGEQVVTVIQVPGASSESMAKGFRSGIDPGPIVMGTTGKSEAISGKSVLTFAGQPPLYVYLVGDTAFAIRSDAATAAEILAALP